MFALRKHEQQYRAAVMVVVAVFVVVILLRSAALIVLMLFVAEVVSCSLFRARKRMKKFVEIGKLSRVFVTSK